MLAVLISSDLLLKEKIGHGRLYVQLIVNKNRTGLNRVGNDPCMVAHAGVADSGGRAVRPFENDPPNGLSSE